MGRKKKKKTFKGTLKRLSGIVKVKSHTRRKPRVHRFLVG